MSANSNSLQNVFIDMLKERKKRTQQLLKKQNASWLIITDGRSDDNFEYITGTHVFGIGVALVEPDKLTVMVNNLEESFIKDLPHIDEKVIYRRGQEFETKLNEVIKKSGTEIILVNNAFSATCRHANRITHSTYKQLSLTAEKYEKTLRSAGKFVFELRRIKTPSELKILEYSVEKTLGILAEIKSYLKPGKSEREIMAELYRQAYVVGEPSFEPIVAVDENTANPHHISSNKKITSNSIIYIDFGVRIYTLSADITRVYYTGSLSDSVRDTYHAVYEAQNAAIEKIRAGIPASEPDKVARETLKKLGYDPDLYFTHSLGHALGVDVHDVGYVLFKTYSDYILEANMAYTVEPGVYLKDRETPYGIRIEDDVVVTKSGVKRLSKAPEEPEAV